MALVVFSMLFSGGLVPTYLIVANALNLKNTIWALVLPGGVQIFSAIIMMNFFRQLPKEIEEAAFVDGANHFSILLKIILPCSLPIIATVILFAFVGQWNSWFSAMLYLRGDEQMPLQNILRNILSTSTLAFETGTEMSVGSSDADQQTLLVESMRYAIIIVSTLPIMCLYPFVQKYFIRGIMVGAIKG
jgi:putative aldouronate transport system permease protein